MNANDEENAIQMCSKIKRVPSHYEKNAVLFITISNIFWSELQIRLKDASSCWSLDKVSFWTRNWPKLATEQS